ncbi:transglutaminaseTgpA domain-containing protein [Pseudarthrobacter sp. J1738]|uniref:transglutaminase family protein n=1 Tax=Pseudarthrobacter sp. J1738 TaxID=3420446 RepID=UPI003D272FD2
MSLAVTPSPFKDGRPAWHLGVDIAALVALLGIGLLGFSLSFGGDPRYLVAGFGGVVLGLGIALASVHFRLGALITAAITLGAYLLFGTALAVPDAAIAGVVPSFESLRTLLLGVVFSWKDMLTVGVPVGTAGGMLVVPFLSAMLCSLAAGLLTWRLRSPFWLLLPVLVLFVTGIAFSTSASFLNVERGLGLALVGITWATFRRDTLRSNDTRAVSANRPEADAGAQRRGKLRRMGMGAAVLAGAVLITTVTAPVLTAADNREVLRDTVVPPFDPRDYITPLASFRNYVKDHKDDTLFEVTGLPKDGRLRLAALDAFNGSVYNMDPNGSGNFAKVGDSRSINTLAGDSSALPTTDYSLDVKVQDYQGYFVPGGTKTTGIEFPSDASGAGESLFFNSGTDTTLSKTGLSKGDEYKVQVSQPVALEHGQMTQYGFASITMPEIAEVPPVVGQLANDIAADAPTAIERVRQLEAHFRTKGAFSNGLVSEGQLPSLSGHGAARIKSLLSGKQMLGDDEQYAVAMALMARQLGIPARVVMGFYPDPKTPENGAHTVSLKGKDVHSWVEVAFDKVGWVAFDPTPPKDNVPIPPDPENKSKPKPQVLQPPPPPQEPAELPADSSPDALDADQKKNDPWLFWGALLSAIGIAAIPIAILAIPLILIALLKSRRRKRRFATGDPAQRVGGGWSEILSLATDLGATLNPRATRREAAMVVGESFPKSQGTTTMLANRADAAIFGAGQPDEQEVSGYWSHVDQSIKEMTGELGFWQRQRAKFSPRSLLADARAAMGSRSGRSKGSAVVGDAGSGAAGSARARTAPSGSGNTNASENTSASGHANSNASPASTGGESAGNLSGQDVSEETIVRSELRRDRDRR